MTYRFLLECFRQMLIKTPKLLFYIVLKLIMNENTNTDVMCI